MIDESLLDADEQALVRKPRPVGWFVAGILLIATVAGTFGYYVPLSAAHQKLVKAHEGLAKKASELDHALKQDRAVLASTEAGRAALQKFVDAGAEAEKESTARIDAVRAIAEDQLKGFTKGKLLEISTERVGLRLAFQEKALFLPRSAVASGGAKAVLCKAVGSIATEKDWLVTAVVRAPENDTKYWETAADKGAALAKILSEGCKFPSDNIVVRAAGSVSSDGKSTPAGVTEIYLGPQAPPHFSPGDAPATKTEGG
jgi:hypothetical protein